MNDLFILVGSFCGEDNYDLIRNYFKNNVTVSNSEYERVLMNGFLKNSKKVLMISAPAVGKYPLSCKKMFTKLHSRRKDIIIANYCTFLPFVSCSKYHSLKKELLRIIAQNSNYKITLVVCEAHYPYLRLLKYCKSKLNLKTSLIVPDLPENVGSSKLFLYKILKKRIVRKIYEISNCYTDFFLFFTEKMVSKFCVTNNYLVREGVIDNFFDSKKRISTKINCTYIGKVDEENGISFIFKSAEMLPNFDFYIYGNGNMEDLLKDTKLGNLHYFGFLDPQRVNEKLAEADILLSPRLPKDYTNYSFPSKLLKYISFCKPIVTFKLPCYPESFANCLVYPKEVSAEDFCQAILEAAANLAKFDFNTFFDVCNYLLSENVVKDYLSKLTDF